MKKTITTLLGVIALLFISLHFTSCKKGNTGPQGPAGANGSSNVQTFTMTTVNSDWVITYAIEYDAVISIPAITSAVVDRGTVQVFVDDGVTGAWEAMPLSYTSSQYNYTYEVGKVTVFVTTVGGALPANPGEHRFKIVVIPSAP